MGLVTICETSLFVASYDSQSHSGGIRPLVQEYTFTLKEIANALINAKERGVDVKVILDKSQLYSKYSVINELFASGIPVWIDDSF
jgi:phosphatidylserine/phosphatidylglycerophosphate/cardiolipin synthase-like enzyme